MVSGDVPAEVARLKERTAEGELQIHGSGTLARSLLAHDLIDEINLLVHPVYLGGGRRLFPEGGQPTAFELTGARTTGSGIAIHTYRPAGRARFGDYDLPGRLRSRCRRSTAGHAATAVPAPAAALKGRWRRTCSRPRMARAALVYPGLLLCRTDSALASSMKAMSSKASCETSVSAASSPRTLASSMRLLHEGDPARLGGGQRVVHLALAGVELGDGRVEEATAAEHPALRVGEPALAHPPDAAQSRAGPPWSG